MMKNDPDVGLYTREILFWMIESGKKEEYSTQEIAEVFDLLSSEASKRLKRLRGWGLIKLKRRKFPRTYVVTKWGEKWYLEKKKGGQT